MSLANVYVETLACTVLPLKWSPGAGRQPHSKQTEGAGVPPFGAGCRRADQRTTRNHPKGPPHPPRLNDTWGVAGEDARASIPACWAGSTGLRLLGGRLAPPSTPSFGVSVTVHRSEQTDHPDIAA